MNKTAFIILILGQALFFTSCLTTKETNLLREPGGSIPAYPMADGIGEYRIKQGDELQILITASSFDSRTEQLFSLFSSKNSTGLSDDPTQKLRVFTVNSEGSLYFPYLGDVYVLGMNTLEVRNLLKEKLSDGISEDCLIQVYLANRYFSVIGETNSSRYPIAKEQTTIYQALAQCGDIKPYGDRSKIKIIRQTENGSIIKTFDIRSSDIVNSEFYYIQPNDVIYIQPLGRQFLGIDSFGAFFAILSTVASLGLMVYSLVKK